MEKPSDHWTGFAGLNSESDKYKRIQLLLSSANFEYLKTRGIESRRRHQPNLPAHVECSVNLTHFTSGFNNLVLELAFSDNVYWIARIPHQALDDGDKTSMLSEIATMRIIQKHTTIPIPRVFDFEMSADQPFGHPYVFVEYLGGRSLPNGLATTIPRQYHGKVAKQLANVFAELQNLTFSRIGRLWCGENADQPVEIMAMAWHSSPGPLETSFEYFYNQRQDENREIMAMHPDDSDWLTACWVLKTALTQIIVEDRVRGPFPLCHLDLHFGNMLFDNEYNLTGIIDWSSAQAAPLEQLSVCPEFITFPGLSDEENQPIVELKNLVVQSIKEMEKDQDKRPPLDNPEADMTLSPNLTLLSTYMVSKSAEVTHRQYMASPRGSLWAGKMIAKLIYGNSVTWEQLREVYGTMPLF
ncbi:kinase-like domain-containing protein [Ilyonectria destructans]|nr:kinase-like domain-containing protein [Ilyonectria destructans]